VDEEEARYAPRRGSGLRCRGGLGGRGIDLIDRVEPAGRIVARLVAETEAVLARV
jgi:hypothetical protein